MGEEELRWGECSFPRGSAIPGHQSGPVDMFPCARTPCAHMGAHHSIVTIQKDHRDSSENLSSLCWVASVPCADRLRACLNLPLGRGSFSSASLSRVQTSMGEQFFGGVEADAHACARSIRRLPARTTAHPRSGAGPVTEPSALWGRTRMEAPSLGRPGVTRSPAATRTIPRAVAASHSLHLKASPLLFL